MKTKGRRTHTAARKNVVLPGASLTEYGSFLWADGSEPVLLATIQLIETILENQHEF